jgi:hypothetical protein
VIGLTETWLNPDELTVLNENSPPGYTSDHIAKADVLPTFMTANFYLQKIKTLSSFALLVMKSMQPTQSLFIATVLQASWAIYSVPH